MSVYNLRRAFSLSWVSAQVSSEQITFSCVAKAKGSTGKGVASAKVGLALLIPEPAQTDPP
jgi:hypothetical protein